MTDLVILGSAASIPNEEHENTHMALVRESGVVLIDCVGTPVVRLAKADIQLQDVDDLILTHFHPDHVSGVPMLFMNMWLTGRAKPLRVYGLHHCLKRVEDMMGFYGWENWPGFFPVAFHRLPETEGMTLMEAPDVQIRSTPVRHLLPNIGIRIDTTNGHSVVYSSDTEPCPSLIRLAEGVDLLIHEASGTSVGHSSARQAGEVAERSGAGRLLLIHYPPDAHPGPLMEEARQSFSGEVEVAYDFMRISLA